MYGFTKEKIDSLYDAEWCLRLINFDKDMEVYVDGPAYGAEKKNLANLQWFYNTQKEHEFGAKEWMDPAQAEGYHALLYHNNPNLLTREDSFLYLVLSSGSTMMCKSIFKDKYRHLKLST